jgi:hypothetical protein
MVDSENEPPKSYLFQNKLIPVSSGKVWNENECFRLVFTKMLVFMHKTECTYTVKKVHEFPVSSRDVTNQTPPGQE